MGSQSVTKHTVGCCVRVCVLSSPSWIILIPSRTAGIHMRYIIVTILFLGVVIFFLLCTCLRRDFFMVNWRAGDPENYAKKQTTPPVQIKDVFWRNQYE